MFGGARKTSRQNTLGELFWSAWDRSALRLDPTWSASLVRGVRTDTAEIFEDFCGRQGDDKLAVRYFLAAYTSELARFGVLVIPPPPNVDDIGFRDGELITGDLRSLLDSVVASPEGRAVLGIDAPPKFSSAYDFCLGKYQMAWVIAHAFNALRVHLEKPKAPDWYMPGARVMYAYWEDQFRVALRMPRTLPDELDSFRYSAITDLIVNGHSNPYAKWLEMKDL